jgi:DNA replication protein DnaC
VDASESSQHELLESVLKCIQPALLDLVRTTAVFSVGQGHVPMHDLNGAYTGTFHAFQADGVCVVDGKDRPRIYVRSYVDKDTGSLCIEPGTLMHEIGHLFDLVLSATPVSGKSSPLNETKEVVEEWNQHRSSKHPIMSSYFLNSQKEFVAEVFARYCFDKKRTGQAFPATVKVIDDALQRLGVASALPSNTLIDDGKLRNIMETMLPFSPLTSEPNAWESAIAKENLNEIKREKFQTLGDSYIIAIETQDDFTARAFSSDFSRRLFVRRTHRTRCSSYAIGDCFQSVDMSGNAPLDRDGVDLFDTSYDKTALVILSPASSLIDEELLKKQSNAPLKTSAAMGKYFQFAERMGDLCVMCVYGSQDELGKFTAGLKHPSMPVHPYVIQTKICSMTQAQILQQLKRKALTENCVFSELAKHAFLNLSHVRGTSVNLSTLESCWANIKESQNQRVCKHLEHQNIPESAVMFILCSDVDSGLHVFGNCEEDPMSKLNKMIGLDDVKRKVTQLLAGQKLSEVYKLHDLKVSAKLSSRMNLLFLGNPGTGKSVISSLIRDVLLQLKLINDKYSGDSLKAGDIKNKDEIRRLFVKNKGGVVFIDEFHQFNDTKEGRDCAKALLGPLEEAEYNDTVFIGAGYTIEVEDMLKNVDPGLDRRFPLCNRMTFADFSYEELGCIWDLKIAQMCPPLKSSPETRELAIKSFQRQQRALMNPTNAGGVRVCISSICLCLLARSWLFLQDFLNHAFEKQKLRYNNILTRLAIFC